MDLTCEKGELSYFALNSNCIIQLQQLTLVEISTNFHKIKKPRLLVYEDAASLTLTKYLLNDLKCYVELTISEKEFLEIYDIESRCGQKSYDYILIDISVSKGLAIKSLEKLLLRNIRAPIILCNVKRNKFSRLRTGCIYSRDALFVLVKKNLSEILSHYFKTKLGKALGEPKELL